MNTDIDKAIENDSNLGPYAFALASIKRDDPKLLIKSLWIKQESKHFDGKLRILVQLDQLFFKLDYLCPLCNLRITGGHK